MSEDTFTVLLRIEMRACRADDLPALEWMGLYSPHRRILAEAFAAQQEGRAVFLLGIASGYPVAQVIVDWPAQADGPATFWAVRTFFPLHGLGIGRRLMAKAENLAAARGIARGELLVDPADAGARAFYEKLGWAATGERDCLRLMEKRLDPCEALTEPVEVRTRTGAARDRSTNMS